MAVNKIIHPLEAQLSSKAAILSDPSAPEFQELLKRWSDIDVEVPAAIVLPATESDCQRAVIWAHKHKVAFVIKSGGHSPWSTIGSHGVIFDLDRFSDVTVDEASSTATITGSALTNEAYSTLANAGVFTALGNGNTVGAIPYFLGGGGNPFNPLIGYASDNILSARVVTASGDLIDANPTSHPDLLWAIRGAGQFFGLITSLTVRTYPLSLLGNPQNMIVASTFVFPVDRAEDVARAMKPLMNDETYNTFGLLMIVAPPPAFKPVLLVAGKLFGSEDDASVAYKPLYDLGPLQATSEQVRIERLNDSLDYVCTKGGLRRFALTGMHEFNIDSFLKTVTLFQELLSERPDAKSSMFSVDWHSRFAKSPASDSAMSFHDIRMWQNNFLWYTDDASTQKVIETNVKSVEAMRESQTTEEYVDFPNSTRTSPEAWRYRGKERLAKLKELKREWDPDGVFTRQFL